MRQLLQGLRQLKTREQRAFLIVMLMAEVGDVSTDGTIDAIGGGIFAEIIKWIIENPEEFAKLIEFIIGLFG